MSARKTRIPDLFRKALTREEFLTECAAYYDRWYCVHEKQVKEKIVLFLSEEPSSVKKAVKHLVSQGALDTVVRNCIRELVENGTLYVGLEWNLHVSQTNPTKT